MSAQIFRNDCPIFEVLQVTEKTAIETARFRGRGDEIAADNIAVSTMHNALNALHISGEVAIGEGDDGEADKLFIGEKIGNQNSHLEFDIAVDPLEGHTLCAKNNSNALTVLALAQRGSVLKVPHIYMNKIAIGPGYEEGVIDLDKSVEENINSVADAKNASVNNINVCVLDRPRNMGIIDEIREAGASVSLISDGDISGVLKTCIRMKSETDLYMGIGGAQEAVFAAIAMVCLNGQMQTRFDVRNNDHKKLLNDFGFNDIYKKYEIDDMIKGDAIFSATGITDGDIVSGVLYEQNRVITHSFITSTYDKNYRRIRTQHSTHE